MSAFIYVRVGPHSMGINVDHIVYLDGAPGLESTTIRTSTGKSVTVDMTIADVRELITDAMSSIVKYARQ